MSNPKLHHTVPQFHLRRFADSSGKLWVWDRERDRIFQTSPGAIAAQTQFYRLTQYESQGHDPATMEKQFAHLEGEVAMVTDQWLEWLRDMASLQTVPIPSVNRELVAQYLALQYLRTEDTRDILAALSSIAEGKPLSPDELREFHTDVLWDEDLVTSLVNRFEDSIWLFARNETATPFVTSDNPVAFRSADSRKWVRAGVVAPGTYAVFPLAPDIVLYCHPREAPWEGQLDRFADCLSPVELDEEMVRSENSGQVFMASRYVLSCSSDFDAERAFARTIRSAPLVSG